MARSSSSSGPSAAADRSDQRLLGRPGQLLGLGRLERAPRLLRGVERELGGALKERGGRRHSAARLRPPGRALQLVGDVLVGRERGRARCQARRSGSTSASVAAASARCAARRSSADAAR